MTKAERVALMKATMRSAIALGALADSIVRQCEMLLYDEQPPQQEKAGNADAPRAEDSAPGAGEEIPFSELNPRVFGKSGGARATIPQRPPGDESQ